MRLWIINKNNKRQHVRVKHVKAYKAGRTYDRKLRAWVKTISEKVLPKEEIKKKMNDGFYNWALTHNVRGGRKVIRKIFDVLEKEEVSLQDDGNYQLTTGSYGLSAENKKTFVKLIYNPKQMSLTVFMREKEYK
ncbi:MAG: hypothetical protein QXW39_06225 [Candidatus Bathyarchaeia archaeon]